MSEQGLGEEALNDDPDNIPDNDAPDDNPDDGLSDLEREQMEKGWRPKDQWDGDPDDWVSAARFKEKGELLTEIGKLKQQVGESTKQFEDRLKNATMFVNMQNNLLKQELEKQREQAIKEGDVAEVKALDKKIKDIPEGEAEETPEQKRASDGLLIAEWKAEHPWIFDESSEKFKYADNLFKIASAKGMSTKEALAHVDEKIAERYPDKPGDVNPRRNEPGLGDGGGKKGGGGKSGLIPKSQWTREELQIAESLEGQFTDKQIAQMVTDSRSKGNE